MCIAFRLELAFKLTQQERVIDQYSRSSHLVTPDSAVELHAANRRQVITVAGKEQVLEQVLGGILGRRLTRAHHAVDLDHGFQVGRGRIDTQGAGNIRTAIQIIDVQRTELLDARFNELLQ